MRSGVIRKREDKVTIPHHTGDLAEGTLRAILREAGIEVGSFLKA